ncbi:hypothetical protein NONI108955_01465 [Nocardia ninae]|uniref:Uncharacterized protein n=1 Tax=Nocardia ninae NBRC 108245 TaxID=1210091 RepID=A0A511MCD4_9NOCA|nr:hypothetical protein [Nocardia ninae]GEM38249.1 hypothetical protein NN4_27680 [Nocardia ninae NBRC 108245]
MANNLYIVQEYDDNGMAFDESLADTEYFDDADFGGDAEPAALAAWEAATARGGAWKLLKVG